MNPTDARRLGPYEIISLLGAGGMGEVYRARDSRLNRIVAVKVLPQSLTANATMRARLEAEARAISSLSHPHICALYDVGREGDADYLVMEYLEGETLADRIARGPLPLAEVVRYGVQISEALQHAHRAGFAHRDLKPGNVMITSGGAKLLDFGLAKLVESSSAPVPVSIQATQKLPLTAEGSIVGTCQYMSPEQLEGRPVDQRTDIFSLGVILYEMATGHRPFRGSSAASVIASILGSPAPPLRSLQPAAPPELERIVATALEKNPDDRWQSAQDVGRQLRWLVDGSTSAASGVPGSPVTRRRNAVAWGVAGALVAAFLVWGGLSIGAARRHTAVPSARLQIWLPPDSLRLVRFYDSNTFAISPNGRTLCFLAVGRGDGALYLRDIDSFAVRKLDGTEGATGPFWSSDGQWIAFSSQSKLWKTKVSGGAAPVALCPVAAGGAVGSWVGNTILFSDAAGGRSGVLRISSSGGAAEDVTHVKSLRDWRHSWPYLLPDGEHFLYQAYARDSIDRRLVFASLRSNEESLVMMNVSQPRVAGDHLLFVRDARLLSQDFDPGNGKLSGDPAAVAMDVGYFYPTGRADFDVASGTVVYRTDTSSGRIAVVARNGTETRLIDDQNVYYDFGLSRDGAKAAVSVVNRATGLADIWIYDIHRGVRERFTSDPWHEVSPVFSPDGRLVFYSEAAGGTFPHIVRRSLGGSTSVDISPRGPFQFARSLSSDGQTLYYTREDPHSQSDIFRMDLRTGKSSPVLDSAFNEMTPDVSPDGRWLAFSSDKTGQSEVYVMDITADESVPLRVSSSGGSFPLWRRDGRELFYMRSEGVVVSAVQGASGSWSDATAHDLLTVPGLRRFAPMPDGASFVVMRGSPGPGDALLNVILGVQ